MTEIDGKYFNPDSAAGRMTDIMQELMSGEIPAFVIRQTCEDIDKVTAEALKTFGWSLVQQKPSFDVNVTARKSFGAFWFSSRHIDLNGYPVYPETKIEGIHVRGHDAIKGAAEVWTRKALLKEVGSPSHRFKMFGPCRKNPIHTTIQNPGDWVMFILYGGIVDGVVMPPAQHDFKKERFIARARQIRLTSFVVLPSDISE